MTPAAGNGGARVLMPSLRRLNAHAGWCSLYEFEDVIRSVDDVDLLELRPASRFELRQRVTRSLAWRGLGRFSPGVVPVRVEREYDLFVFVAMNAWDLLALEAIRGWRQRCRKKICYLVEFYAGQEAVQSHLLAPLAGFDHVALSFSSAVPAVGKVVSRPCHHVALAADVLRFTPRPSPPERVIDVLSMGRRSEDLHRELRRLAAARRAFYVHDTIPGSLVRPSSPVEHRDQLASCAMRSRFLVTYPAKFGDDENRGGSEVGARYYEGSAAGALLLGQAPTVPAFAEDFPWPDAVVEPRPDGSDVGEILARFRDNPEAQARASARNAENALRRHDWAHRWRSLLAVAGVDPRPALPRRLEALRELADGAPGEGATP